MAVRISDDAPLITPLEEDEQQHGLQLQPMAPKQQRRLFVVNVNESWTLGLAIAHILLGTCFLGLAVVSMFLGCQLFFLGTPAWCGAFFMATGVSGIVSSKKKDQCIVIGFLVTSAIAIAGALILTVHGVYSFFTEDNLPAYGDEDDYGVTPSSIQSRKAVDGIIACLATIEFFVAIASTSTCAKALQQPLLPRQPQRAPIYMIPAVSVDGRVLNVARRSNQSDGVFYIPTKKGTQQSTMVTIPLNAVESHA